MAPAPPAAVAVAPVAMAAQNDLDAAARAQEQAGGTILQARTPDPPKVLDGLVPARHTAAAPPSSARCRVRLGHQQACRRGRPLPRPPSSAWVLCSAISACSRIRQRPSAAKPIQDIVIPKREAVLRVARRVPICPHEHRPDPQRWNRCKPKPRPRQRICAVPDQRSQTPRDFLTNSEIPILGSGSDTRLLAAARAV